MFSGWLQKCLKEENWPLPQAAFWRLKPASSVITCTAILINAVKLPGYKLTKAKFVVWLWYNEIVYLIENSLTVSLVNPGDQLVFWPILKIRTRILPLIYWWILRFVQVCAIGRVFSHLCCTQKCFFKGHQLSITIKKKKKNISFSWKTFGL